jgi:hypothetical protein
MKKTVKYLRYMAIIVVIILDISYVYARHEKSLQSLINPPKGVDKKTWLGADAATSIHISGNRYIWLFGDTIIGKSNFPKRYPLTPADGGFVHNSVGVTQCAKGTCSPMKKYFKPGFKAVFSPETPNQYYWVLSGSMIYKKLFLVACRLDSKSTAILGTTFLVVDNPESLPSQWHVETAYNVPNTNDQLNWFTSVVKNNNYLYIFGEQGTGYNAKTVLSRISLEAVANQQWNRRQFFSNGVWASTAKPTVIKGLPGTSEMSVIYYHDKWFTIQIPPFGYKVIPYKADNLSGPWKADSALYTIPAPWSTEKRDGKLVFSTYAPKLHPEMSRHDEVVMTYNTNTNNFVIGSKLANKIFYADLPQVKYQGLYIPQFGTLPGHLLLARDVSKSTQ